MYGPAVLVLEPDLYIVNCPSLRFTIHDGFDIYTVSMLPKDQATPTPIARAILAERKPAHVWSDNGPAVLVLDSDLYIVNSPSLRFTNFCWI
jgi:hypothetical protein